MERFFLHIFRRFGVDPQTAVREAMELKHSHADMLYILYYYLVCLSDPFLQEERFLRMAKQLSLPAVFEALSVVYGDLFRPEHQEDIEYMHGIIYADSGVIETSGKKQG